MEWNVGTSDRVLRFVAGAAVVGFAWYYPSVPYSFLGWLGLFPIATSVFGICPLYSLFGISSVHVPDPPSR